MKIDRLLTVKEKCYSSLNAGIQRLCEIETWPRPRAARRLIVGHDFSSNSMHDIPELNDFIDCLNSDEQIRDNYSMNPEEPNNWRLYGFWELLLLRLLPEVDGSTLRRDVFNKWFNVFIRELYKPEAVWRTVQLVSGLGLNIKRISFDKATVLIPRPEFHSLQKLWGNQMFISEGYFEPKEWLGTGLDKAIIVITENLLKKDYSFGTRPPPHLTRDFERSSAIIDAIRLVVPGTPRLHYYAQVQLSHFPLHEPLAFRHQNGETLMYEKEAQVKKSDVFLVKRIWNDLMESIHAEPSPLLYKPKPLDVAFSGLARSYGLRSWIDDIVDLTISLESIFGPKDDTGELSHRISIRAAWLLSRDRIKSKDKLSNTVYKCVRTMYEIRSRRVHGGLPKDSEVHKWIQILTDSKYEKDDKATERRLIPQAVESARDIVRTSIRACLELQKLKKAGDPCWPLPKDFDQNILLPNRKQVWQKAAKIKPLN